ncbi:MAG: 16S rRNA pseudouridine(516) synthase [Clostridia bacterium]|nr:16S rRNA pseudouridine(516) synthase [Clostridia bacterium]
MQRLDKAFSSCKLFSRTEIAKVLKQRRVCVNEVVVTKPDFKVDLAVDKITLDGNIVSFNKYAYIMLNKPYGVVSSTDDGRDTTVIDILPSEFKRDGLFPVGRLDKDTVGLVILTDDGASAHKRLSPKTHAEKVYYFEVADEVLVDTAKEIEQGVLLKDGYTTKPCRVKLISSKSGEITLTEGKYHEIKRIFGAKGNKITFLKRIEFAGIKLDDSLGAGECRYLTESEIELFTK